MKRAALIVALAACGSHAPTPATNAAPPGPQFTGAPLPTGFITPSIARTIAVQEHSGVGFRSWIIVVTVDDSDPRIKAGVGENRDAGDVAMKLYAEQLRGVAGLEADFNVAYPIQNGAQIVTCRSDAETAKDPSSFECLVSPPGG